MSYGFAVSSAPSLPLAAQFARLESYLPCAGPCGLPGPHRTYAAPAGGVIALCGDCRRMVEAQRFEHSPEGPADMLHRSSSAKVAA